VTFEVGPATSGHDQRAILVSAVDRA
jgi:hypothetical protein